MQSQQTKNLQIIFPLTLKMELVMFRLLYWRLREMNLESLHECLSEAIGH